MRHEVEAADEMIERLSNLMRTTLKTNSSPEVSLREKLQLVNKYIEIESMRFLDRLRFAIHADGDALDASVPTLLLLPIVENAVRHWPARRNECLSSLICYGLPTEHFAPSIARG